MNIQNLINNIATTMNTVANSRPVDTNQQAEVPKDVQAAQQQANETAKVPVEADQVKLSNPDDVKALLRELTTRLSMSQKTFENMPESLKNEIRQLLSQKATLFDMTGGLANLVQGQKEVFNNLNRLAETLSNLAKFLASAQQAEDGETMPQLPQNPNQPALTKEAVLENMNAKLLQELLDSIGKNMQQTEGKPQAAEQKTPEQGKATPEQAQNQKEAAKQEQPAQTVINRQTANTNPQINQQQANQQKEVIELLKNLYQELSSGEGKEGQASKEAAQTARQDLSANAKDMAAQTKEQTGQAKDSTTQQAKEQGQQTAKTDSNSFFKEATVVKGLAEALGKENLAELLKNLKAATQGEQVPQNGKTAGNSNLEQAQTKPAGENALLQLAKQTAPTQNLSSNITPQQIEQLVKNLKTFTLLIEQNTADNPQLARALQTLSNNPAQLSMEDKALLQSVIAQIIRDVFKGKNELGVLEKALNRLASKERMFLDKETTDLQTFNRLLKNADSLQYSRQQVERWANALRELAGGMAKTSGFNADKSSQHLHSSFVFNLATDGQDKNSPVYINVYHEKEDNTPGASKSAETWLRVKVEPEYLGEVTAIFHLYQENLLDVKVIFNNDEAIGEFNRFLPNIEEALQNTNMQLNSLLVI